MIHGQFMKSSHRKIQDMQGLKKSFLSSLASETSRYTAGRSPKATVPSPDRDIPVGNPRLGLADEPAAADALRQLQSLLGPTHSYAPDLLEELLLAYNFNISDVWDYLQSLD